jgi:hypothetical protein
MENSEFRIRNSELSLTSLVLYLPNPGRLS